MLVRGQGSVRLGVRWCLAPSDEGDVFAFLTCEPNPLIMPIHPKAMSVILHPEDYDDWLSGDDAEKFAVPFQSQLMSMVT